MSKDNGGPAFPREDYQANGHARGFEGLGQEGMSLRDYFAAKAMQAIISTNTNSSANEVCRVSYITADAMLEARK